MQATGNDRYEDGAKLSTGIPGLDYVLYGGLQEHGGHGPSVVIRGPPGSGKSVLGGTIACHTFTRGRSVAYFTLEQTAADVKSQLRQFGWGNATCIPDAAFILDVDYLKLPSKGPPAGSTAFLISQYQALGISAVTETPSQSNIYGRALHAHIEQRLFFLKRSAPGLVVIDSLASGSYVDTIANQSQIYELQRTLFLALCEVGQSYGAHVVVLIETTSSHDWHDYVVDVVLALGAEVHDDAPGTIRRYVQVNKARYQPIMDGRHLMRIVPSVGIEVYPETCEVLRRAEMERSCVTSEVRSADVVFSSDTTLNDFLGAKIARGSAVLLYGPDATRKNVVASRFLEQGLTEGNVLFLGAGITENVTRDMLRHYLMNSTPEHLLENVTIMQIGRHFEAPSEAINRVRARLLQGDIVRAVIDDVAAVAGKPEFVVPVKELLCAHGVTSLTVHTVRVDEESPIREAFDHIIRARYVSLPGAAGERIGYQVLKLQGASKGGHSWEVSYDELQRELKVSDALREWVEDEKGQLHLFPLHLFLNNEYDDAREAWENQARVVFDASNVTEASEHIPTLKLFNRVNAEAIFESILQLPVSYRFAATYVLNFDQFWAKPLIESDKLMALSGLLDKGPMVEEFVNKSMEAVTRVNANGIRTEYGIPHHLDCGIYVIRTDFITKDVCSQCSISSKDLDGPLCWEKLVELVNVAYDLRMDEEGKRGGEKSQITRKFDWAGGAGEESFLCFILEVLWPFIFLGNEYVGLDDSRVYRAVYVLHKNLKRIGAVPIRLRELSNVEEPIPAICQRQWYVSFRRACNRQSDIAPYLKVIPAPKLVLYEKENHGEQAASISGEWYLGIVNGSPNARRGMWAIRALTTQNASRRIYAADLGLPTYRVLLDTLVPREVRAIYKHSVSRSSIPQYHVVRSLLIDGFARIFSNGNLDETGIEAEVRALNEDVLQELARRE